MIKFLRLIATFITFGILTTLTFAQDNPYADAPMSRTEDGAFVIGNTDTPVKIIEFTDYLCDNCQQYAPIMRQFIQDYVLSGQVQLERRIIPVIDLSKSTLAANLVECANTLSDRLYWQAHDLMFDLVIESGFDDEVVTKFADAIGLDEADLRECADAPGQIAIDMNYANQLGILGTPSIYVQYGDDALIELFPMSLEQFAQVINATRPEAGISAIVSDGRYEGIPTYRTEDGGFVLGQADAPLTLVAFEDFMCPHCQNYQETVHQFIETFVKTGQAKFEYRFYPVVNPEFSLPVAKVAECVAYQDLGKFWQGHDLIFEHAIAQDIDPDIALIIAIELGLDANELDACTQTSVQPYIDYQLGQLTQVQGTPGIRVRGEDGLLNYIYLNQEPLTRGAVPIDVLTAAFTGSNEASIGAPALNLLNNQLLHDTSLSTGEPCKANCWQNITPGETTVEDARAIIEGLENFAITQESENGIAFSSGGSVTCCQLGSQDGITIDTIFLQLAPDNLLGDIISLYGEPAFVDGESFAENQTTIALFYPEHSMVLYAFVAGESGQLSESSEVINAIFITPETMEAVLESSLFDNWKGYLSYGEYMDGTYDKSQ